MYELCPFCGLETEFDLNKDIKDNGNIKCEHCGQVIKTCSICSHRFNGHYCDSDGCFEYDNDMED